ncbi:hypothetical protein PsYK624_078300 [Phanerochaete sordida]|uniref:F-box domain-containing protein n=1 Tax=Phanerochaete sordida TaxID=48140 RepID=A0A9P3GD71_9APHY|nr:hypothetical protein PsYK624_078300 [Phanerochaete sordida]
MVSVTAADIPVELHRKILTSLDLTALLESHDESVLKTQRHQLIQLATVCRHWAYVCRPLIFDSVVFDSRQKVDRLVRLLDSESTSSGSTLQPSFRQLYFSPGTDLVNFTGTWSGFWVGLTSQKLPYLRGIRDLNCILSATVSPSAASPQSNEGYAPRSWSVGLPRTLPPALIRMSELYLRLSTFRHADDFLSLLESTGSLQRVTCTGVTFAEPTAATAPQRMPRARGGAPYTVYVFAGGDADADLHVALTAVQYSARHGAPAFCLGETKWGLVCSLLRSLASFFWDHNHSVRVRVVALSERVRALDAGFSLVGSSSSHGVRVVWGPDADALDPLARGAGRVLGVQLSFFGESAPVDGPTGLPFTITTLAWAEFEAAALALDTPSSVGITVMRNPQAYIELLKIIARDAGHGPLSRLHERGKLNLVFDISPYGTSFSPASISFGELSTAPERYAVDGVAIMLSVQGRFEVWLCGYDGEGKRLNDEEAGERLQAYAQKELSGKLTSN